MEALAPSPVSQAEPGLPAVARRPRVLLILAVLIALVAVLVAVLARPAVSTFDIQRRDRLAPAARFVPFAYEFLLGRAPDPQGLATYQRTFDEQGPTAVAAQIAQSPEFRARTDRADGGASVDRQTDIDALARQVVSAYQADESAQRVPADALGRIGFVALILACLLAVAYLNTAAHRAATVRPSGATRGTTLREDGSPSPAVASAPAQLFVPARYIVGLFAALALMAWASSDLLLGSFGRSSRFVYIEWLSQVTTVTATYGLTNVWTPYPQGSQDLVVALAGVANAMASNTPSDIWTSYSVFRILFQFVFLLVPSVLTVAVVASLGGRISPQTGTLAALGVAFSIAPIYYGILAAYVTDPLPALLTVVAVRCLATRRNTLAGLAIGVGAVLKLFPLLLLPVALVYACTNQARVRVSLAAGLVIAAVFVPPALSNFDIFMSPFRWQTGRPAWESWYAFANWVASAPHEYRLPYFIDSSVGDAFGWVFWGITPRISTLLAPVQPAPPRWENAASLVGSACVIVMCLTARRRSILALTRWSLFALAGFLFWGIGWSPQYELFVVPFVLLAVRPPSVGLLAALLLEGLTLLEYPVLLPWAYFYGGAVVWIVWAALLGRYILLGWLCVYVIQTESSLAALAGRLARLKSLGGLLGKARQAHVATALAVALFVSTVVPSAVHAQPTGGAGGCNGVVHRMKAQVADPVATDADFPLSTGHFFSQASLVPGAGYSIVDDDKARFWSEFQRLGGTNVLGYPATRRFTWHGLLSQGTQRAILQWFPVTGQVEFANVLDLLHEEGMDNLLLQLYQIPPPTIVDEAGLPYETIAERRLQWLDARPAIKKVYCDAPGGADPLVLWGLPTSAAIDVGNPGTVFVVRTQRAAFQEWVDGAPWAAPDEVTVVLAGDLAKDFHLLPSDAGVTEPAPPPAT